MLLVALGLALVLAAAAAGVAYWQARSIVGELQAGPKKVEVTRARRQLQVEPKRHLVAPTVEAAKGAQTILIIGSDRRLQTPKDAVHSDTVILARVDATHHRISLLSIPRDLYVPIAAHGHDRINDAFTLGGASLLIRTVREVFGVKIDHFVEVNFAGFRKLVDSVGGIYLPVDQRYLNTNVGTSATNYANIDLQPGYQLLNGTAALEFARFRHTDSDFYRAARQQLFLRAVLAKVTTFTPNLVALRDRAEAFAKATTSDISSLSELWWLFRAVHGTSASQLRRTTLQAKDLTLYGAFYLSATDAERQTAVHALYAVPATKRKPGTATTTTTASTPPEPPPVALAPDGGTGERLLASQVQDPPLRSDRASPPATGGRRKNPSARTRSPAIPQSPRTRRPARAARCSTCSRPGRTLRAGVADLHRRPRRPHLRRVDGGRPHPPDRLEHRADPRVDHEHAARRAVQPADDRARSFLQADSALAGVVEVAGERAGPVQLESEGRIVDEHGLVDELRPGPIVAGNDARDARRRLERRPCTQNDRLSEPHLAVAELEPCATHVDRRRSLPDPRKCPDVITAVTAEKDLAQHRRPVDVQDERPRRLRLVVVVRVGHQCTRSGELEAVRLAPLDLPAEDSEADAVRRTPSSHPVDPAARTDRIAVARLEVAPGDGEAHAANQMPRTTSASPTGATARAPIQRRLLDEDHHGAHGHPERGWRRRVRGTRASAPSSSRGTGRRARGRP